MSKPKKEEPLDDYRRAFMCAKRAITHLLNKNHKLRPVRCLGCREAVLLATEPGYRGDRNPVGVDF